jgi:hypothetical protein
MKSGGAAAPPKRMEKDAAPVFAVLDGSFLLLIFLLVAQTHTHTGKRGAGGGTLLAGPQGV